MKVAIVTPTFLPVRGGAEVVVHQEALKLLDLGHEVTVFVPNRFAKGNQNHPYAVVPFWPSTYSIVERVPVLGQRMVRWQLSRYAKAGTFDVWHVHFAYPTGFALLKFLERWKQVGILTCHGADIQTDPATGYGFRLNPVVDDRVRETAAFFPCLTAISESVSVEYEALNVPKDRIRSVPNGVTLDRFVQKRDRIETRRVLGIPPETKVVLAVGRNHPKKGYCHLVEAASFLKGKTDIPFLVMFVGPGVGDLDPLAADLGVSDIIRTVERIEGAGEGIAGDLPPDALIEVYQAADLFVLPSIMETFGMVLVEAMACGLPVVTTDAPGCRDIVSHNENGLVVTAGDGEALANAILCALTDSDLALRISKAGYAKVAMYDWERVTEMYVDVFSEFAVRA